MGGASRGIATADLLVVETGTVLGGEDDVDEDDEVGFIEDLDGPGTLNAETVKGGVAVEMAAAANKKYRRVWLDIMVDGRRC